MYLMTNIAEVEKNLPSPSGEVARTNIHPDLDTVGVSQIHPDETLAKTVGVAQSLGAPIFPAAENIPAVSEPSMVDKINLGVTDTGRWLGAISKLGGEKRFAYSANSNAKPSTSNISDFRNAREKLEKERGLKNAA